MPTRGYIWAVYSSDDGNLYAVRVDRDYVAQPERGWIWPAPPATTVYPRGWSARHVVGVDEFGSKRRAICATTDCDLWTGAVLTFVIQGSDMQEHTCAVYQRVGERWTPRPT